uniref:Multidrug efflux pump subunit AcrB n=1 Tax=Candidatus Kentrum sp. FM TaxID=2126340 RepID=A0A450SKE7_9GAMM|nr:MAG: Multidrug efflux pump subunit AcrB [Candidatus Kentron sp. FM]VFJ60277.1 MAG: Multidrug efflux pump subunit AcrB [Candidatus Kentron sp. FM]VFK13222.1 MAG: Multidrug efflux pump subunit AcrB [Candidatus Kentron sp. FM]
MTNQTTPKKNLPPSATLEEEQEELGLAGRITQAFIDSPLSPLLFLAMLLMGILGLIMTPRQEDPQISVPMVDVMVAYPGASSQQVARLAIDPLQRLMSEIPGVKHVYAASARGRGMVTVEFDVGQELGPSIVKVHDKIQSNMDKIPPGVSPPLVQPKGIDDVPVVTLTLWSKERNDGELRALALEVLQSLKEIPNTGTGFVVGGRREQLRIEAYPERLAGFGIGLDHLANRIRGANVETDSGFVEGGGIHSSITSGAFFTNAWEIERLEIGTHGDVPIYVRDVARVFQAPEDANQIVTYYTGPAAESDPGIGDLSADGESAVTIAIAKKEGTNGVAVAENILLHVENLKGRLIPPSVHVAVTRNYGQTANDKVWELIIKLFIATGLVFLLVLFAFRAFRPAIVVLVVIPVVILITVFSAWVLGYTIDRVSLFALIFSIGILVDDAIVVVENVYRRWLEKERTDLMTGIDAVREVGNPTILATFTVIAALLPMGFVRGMMGPYMEPIPALGSVAMLFSLIAAFAFTPWWAAKLKPSIDYLHRAHEREQKGSERLEGFYRGLLMPLIEHKSKRLLFRLGMWSLFAGACAMFYTTHVRVKMLPLDNKPEFSVTVDLAEGSALPNTANLTRLFAETIRNNLPEVTAVQTYAGCPRPFDFNGMVRHYYLRQEPWQGEVQVQLLHKRDRARSSHEIAVRARELLTPIADAHNARIAVVEMPPGPPVLQSVVAEIYGPDDETRRRVTQHMTEVFGQAESLTDVDNYMHEPYYYWHFDVDRDKAARRRISVDTINRNIDMAMGNYQLGDIKEATVLEPTNIVIQVPLSLRSDPTRLLNLPIPTEDGRTVPLAEIGRFRRVAQDPIIYHKDLRPVEYVVAETTGRLAAPIYGMLQVQDQLKDYVTPDGVKMKYHYMGPPPNDGRSGFEWTGEWTVTYETFRDMGLAFIAALVLIYILVVWEFGNFRIPALIMAPIPLTLIGIIPAHFLMNAEFTATSMIGWIALAGIIVRNSILLVDFSAHEVSRGTPVQEAVILACKTRTRPILITAFALVFGAGVILFDPIFQGMAISLAAGVLISTLLTLVVIPLGCIEASDSLREVGSKYGHHKYDFDKDVPPPVAADRKEAPLSDGPHASGLQPSWGMRIWAKIIGVITVVFYVLRAVVIMLREGLKKSLGQGKRKAEVKPSTSAREQSQSPVSSESPSNKESSGESSSQESSASQSHRLATGVKPPPGSRIAAMGVMPEMIVDASIGATVDAITSVTGADMARNRQKTKRPSRKKRPASAQIRQKTDRIATRTVLPAIPAKKEPVQQKPAPVADSTQDKGAGERVTGEMVPKEETSRPEPETAITAKKKVPAKKKIFSRQEEEQQEAAKAKIGTGAKKRRGIRVKREMPGFSIENWSNDTGEGKDEKK